MSKVNSQVTRLLGDIKATHLSIELNSLLCEYKETPQRLASVLKKISRTVITQWISWLQSTSRFTNSNLSFNPRIRKAPTKPPKYRMSFTSGT